MRDMLAKAASQCEIRILTMDIENPAFAGMLNPDVSAGDLPNKGNVLAETRAWFENAFGDAEKAEVRALKRGMLFQQIIISDDRALISPYLFSANTGYSPLIELKRSSAVFGAYLREFDELWNANA